MTLSKTAFSITINQYDTQHNAEHCYDECHIQTLGAECHYAECRYGECRGANEMT
jgi:hypothetical protein